MFEFYKKAFGAEILHVSDVPDSSQVMHATIKIGDSVFFVNDEFAQHGVLSPKSTGSTSSSIHIQVSEGLDELFASAVAAGAESGMEPQDMFWGDRFAMLTDPSGHKWSIGMSVANPPERNDEELKAMLG